MNAIEIMIVEDERDHFDLIRHAIKKEFPDAGVELCERANLCLERVEQTAFEVVIADYLMSGMNGLELLEELRRRKINIPFIMITAQGNENVAVRAMKSGAFDYVVKSGDFFKLIPQIILKALRDRELKLKVRQAEEALKIKDFAIKSSVNGVIFADLDGNLTYANDSFLKLWGYDSDDEVLGKPIGEMWHMEGETLNLVKTLRENGGCISEITSMRKDGSLLDVQVSATMVADETDKPLCMMASFIDVTDLNRVQKLLVQSQKLSSLGHLSAGLAHELKNPLAVISSCAQFCIENMQLAPLVNENLEMICRKSQQANKLIHDLLMFARPSCLEWKEVDINELAARMWRIVNLDKSFWGVTFVSRLEEGLPKIMGDEEKLGQVFFNLTLNAVQAVTGKGKITLQTRFLAPQNQVEVNVIDDGPGIPEKYRNQIFDPFFTTKDEGVGLGLSVCHSLVEQHRGSITVDCDGKRGTRVSVRLPANQQNAYVTQK